MQLGLDRTSTKGGSNRAEKNTFYILFSVPPQILPFDFGEDSVNSGDPASLNCLVHKGDLPLKIIWLHNNKTVENEFGIMTFLNGKRASSLTIESVGAEHMGEFSCLAQNIAGFDRHSAILNVNGIFQYSTNLMY